MPLSYSVRLQGWTMKRKLLFTALAIFIVSFTGLAIYGAIHNQEVIHSKNIQLESKTFKLQKLETDFKQLNADYQKEKDNNTLDTQKEQEYQQKIKDLEDQYKALEVSKANAKAEKDRLAQASQKVAQAIVPTASAATSGNCGDNMYKQYIYQHESGCRTNALNSSGCYGIGQSCPRSKIAHCGDDFACQDAWFSNYAISRYGSWEQAYNFWLNNHWW